MKFSVLSLLQGHGTLHAIYASIKKSCEVNGWEGVDLLIIGGDFQVSMFASYISSHL